MLFDDQPGAPMTGNDQPAGGTPPEPATGGDTGGMPAPEPAAPGDAPAA